MKKSIALFDFDGTITTEDSTKSFYRYLYTSNLAYLFYNYIMCLPHIFLCKIRAINYLPLKKYRLNLHTSKFNKVEFQDLVDEFCNKHFSKLLNPKAMDKIQWHKSQGHEVWIISASYDFILYKWSLLNEINLITNITSIHKSKRIVLGKDVNYEAKVEYLRLHVNLKNYSEIYAYGDSEGDKAMLSIANFKYYKPFRD